jgi:hypothetical protein
MCAAAHDLVKNTVEFVHVLRQATGTRQICQRASLSSSASSSRAPPVVGDVRFHRRCQYRQYCSLQVIVCGTSIVTYATGVWCGLFQMPCACQVGSRPMLTGYVRTITRLSCSLRDEQTLVLALQHESTLIVL